MKYRRSLYSFRSSKIRRKILNNRGFLVKGVPSLLDPYNGRIIHAYSKWDAEHIVSLKMAWEAGFKDRYILDPFNTRNQMKQLANDPDNLISVSSSSNRSRGSKSIWDWCFLNLAYVPERNRITQELYAKYDLVMTPSQKWAIDWANNKILKKYKYGIHLGKVRSWLVSKGLHKIL